MVLPKKQNKEQIESHSCRKVFINRTLQQITYVEKKLEGKKIARDISREFLYMSPLVFFVKPCNMDLMKGREKKYLL